MQLAPTPPQPSTAWCSLATASFCSSAKTPPPPRVITVLDGHSLNTLGHVPDLWLAGRRTEIEDVDATKLLFGVAKRGLGFIDAANPSSLPTLVPAFAAPPTSQPSEGPNAGGTTTVLAGQNFEAKAQIPFGTQSASN